VSKALLIGAGQTGTQTDSSTSAKNSRSTSSAYNSNSQSQANNSEVRDNQEDELSGYAVTSS